MCLGASNQRFRFCGFVDVAGLDDGLGVEGSSQFSARFPRLVERL